MEDPVRVDLLSWVGDAFQSRTKCRVWQPTPADLEGTVCFHQPAALQPDMPLASPHVPILSLILELESAGWTSVRRQVEHRAGPLRLFDEREASRTYLQCVLASAHLFEHGCVSFVSQRPQAYGRLLLKVPSAGVGAMDRGACERRLADLEHVAVSILVLQACGRNLLFRNGCSCCE